MAINRLHNPKMLGNLEHYLGLTGYLRQKVHFYAQLAALLQCLKTQLLKQAPTKDNPWKAYASRMRLLTPSVAKETSFSELQAALSQPSILTHFDPK